MEVIANQERQSERPVCDEKNNDSLEEILKHGHKRPNPEMIRVSGAGESALIDWTPLNILGITGSSMVLQQVNKLLSLVTKQLVGQTGVGTDSPVIVAVMGLYRTGKSYLVNRLGLSQTAIKKTPTVVPVDGMTFGAFGYEAEDKYKDLVEKDDYGHYFYAIPFKMMLNKTLVESGPRENKTDRKVSNIWYDGLTDGFGFLAEIKRGFEELPKTDLNESPKHMWLEYCQAESPGESRTLLSKPLYDKRPENENFTNHSCKPAEHCTTAMKQGPIIPDNDRLLCKVCYMYELSIVFLPCSHMVACRRCAARLKSCPVCRSGIEEALPANLHE